MAGIYNVALRIQEWRDVDGVLIEVEVVRDMQITVESCTNQPPEIANIPDTWWQGFLSFLVNASDPDGDNWTWMPRPVRSGKRPISPSRCRNRPIR